jgi:hypothetical protein|tara:strand:- start:948 stop:1385 length:438 start_codon:yes stop_codon:yes gene_type:complete
MGRPSKYNNKIAGEILKRFASGEKLTDICKPDRMPSRMSVFRWRAALPEFDKAYEIATQSHTEALLDVLHNIVMSCDDKSAKAAKVKADYITWFCSKLNKRYSERLQVDVRNTLNISPALTRALDRLSALALPDPIIEAEAANVT